MKITALKLCTTYHGDPRRGEYGTVIGACIREKNRTLVPCYTVQYDDGIVDYIPIYPKPLPTYGDNKYFELGEAK